MKEIVILVPELEVDQNIEIDVRINGRKKTMQYRVELISWEGNNQKNRVSTIKHKLDEYDKDWELVEIGAPTDNKVPLILRKRLLENT